jgi:hypothetical protein
MASTPFKVVSWDPTDPITLDKLDAMVDNDNWLKDNTVRGRYGANNVAKDTGIRIASGLARFTAQKAANQQKYVSFANYFSAGCLPIVTTGTVSAHQRQISVTIDGPGSKPQPTRDGFQVHVFVDSNNKGKAITNPFYVSWIALGF